MMKKLFFILIFLLLSGNSLGADCSSIKVNPAIKITSSFGKLSYDTSKNTEQITEQANYFNLVEGGDFAGGLSTVNVNFDVTINTLGRMMEDNSYCVIPTEVTLFLGFDNPVIYISKDIPPDSCQYMITLYHEQTHQQINKTTLEYFLPIFKAASKAIIKKIKPVHIQNINDMEQATATLTKQYNSRINPLVGYIKKETLLQQKRLDNPENYKFEGSLCP